MGPKAGVDLLQYVFGNADNNNVNIKDYENVSFAGNSDDVVEQWARGPIDGPRKGRTAIPYYTNFIPLKPGDKGANKSGSSVQSAISPGVRRGQIMRLWGRRGAFPGGPSYPSPPDREILSRE